jgi:MYXO-CTERM domain-containing protein
MCTPPDGGVGADGGLGSDAGTPPAATTGCGCRASGTSGAPLMGLALLALLVARRR